jgi:membrane protein implicated in regulation of membrane protease activity
MRVSERAFVLAFILCVSCFLAGGYAAAGGKWWQALVSLLVAFLAAAMLCKRYGDGE